MLITRSKARVMVGRLHLQLPKEEYSLHFMELRGPGTRQRA